MAVSKIAHHFARLGGHESLVLAILQSHIDSISNIIRMRKQDVALTNCNVRHNLFAILACPGVHGIEKNTVRAQDVTIFDMLSLDELSESLVQPGHKGRVLETPDDVEVLFSLVISQITALIKVAERIERHSLASRK